ncbi:MAG: dUTP diphosphatase [Planctomycetaceae bacterium]|jgi:dUTP pyrophosphatase|nr:dUTP diphosphatase [Planctomycetaceae bacterium]
MATVEIRFKRIHPGAQMPAYQSAEAAGMDLHACLDAPVTLQPGDLARIPLGFIMAIPKGHEGQVRPRSGLAAKFGVTVPNAPGTIDSDYRGEAMVALINLGRAAFTVEHGMRIAQLIVAPVLHVQVREVDELDATQRGSGGFGSTGH